MGLFLWSPPFRWGASGLKGDVVHGEGSLTWPWEGRGLRKAVIFRQGAVSSWQSRKAYGKQWSWERGAVLSWQSFIFGFAVMPVLGFLFSVVAVSAWCTSTLQGCFGQKSLGVYLLFVFWSAFELFLFVSLTCDEFCKCKYYLICEMTVKPFTMAHIVMFTRVAGHINYIFTTLLCFISSVFPNVGICLDTV